jgi:hypothetical protein
LTPPCLNFEPPATAAPFFHFCPVSGRRTTENGRQISHFVRCPPQPWPRGNYVGSFVPGALDRAAWPGDAQNPRQGLAQDQD